MTRVMGLLLTGALLGGGAAYAQNGDTGAQAGAQNQGGMMGDHMRCGGMMGQANIRVEKTRDGAVIRMSAKDPKDVAAVQEHAERMSSCMGMMGKPTTK